MMDFVGVRKLSAKGRLFVVTKDEKGTIEVEPYGLGNLVEDMAKPFARMMKLPCLNKDGTLKPSSPCGKRKAALNKLL